MQISDADLRHRTVISADGQAVGTVVGLSLDSESWRVASLQVRLRKEAADHLGAARGLLRRSTLDLPSLLVQSVGDAVVLSASLDGLRPLLGDEAEEQPVAH